MNMNETDGIPNEFEYQDNPDDPTEAPDMCVRMMMDAINDAGYEIPEDGLKENRDYYIIRQCCVCDSDIDPDFEKFGCCDDHCYERWLDRYGMPEDFEEYYGH